MYVGRGPSCNCFYSPDIYTLRYSAPYTLCDTAAVAIYPQTYHRFKYTTFTRVLRDSQLTNMITITAIKTPPTIYPIITPTGGTLSFTVAVPFAEAVGVLRLWLVLVTEFIPTSRDATVGLFVE